MKRFLSLVLCVTFVITAGCGKTEPDTVTAIAEPSPVPSPSPRPSPSPTPEPTPDLTGKAVDSLTGLYIDEAEAARRPVAIVINNLHKAKPQSGIAQADLIYEVLAEGDITRLVAVFRRFDSAKIGPVRSARDYFLDFAFDHDAVFVHHGGSPQAYASIRNTGIDHLDGMNEAKMFWRDQARLSQPGMYEHSSYTNAENTLEAVENKGFRADIFEDADKPFVFYDEATTPPAVSGAFGTDKISVRFSPAYTRNFEYDPKTRIYSVFQGENPHIDEETGEQLAVTNIIVQIAGMYVISGDDAGRRNVDLIGNGNGYLMTNGAVTPITWEKAGHKEPTKWLDASGLPLAMNKGKTWICVYDGDVDFNLPEAEAAAND